MSTDVPETDSTGARRAAARAEMRQAAVICLVVATLFGIAGGIGVYTTRTYDIDDAERQLPRNDVANLVLGVGAMMYLGLEVVSLAVDPRAHTHERAQPRLALEAAQREHIERRRAELRIAWASYRRISHPPFVAERLSAICPEPAPEFPERCVDQARAVLSEVRAARLRDRGPYLMVLKFGLVSAVAAVLLLGALLVHLIRFGHDPRDEGSDEASIGS